MPNMGCPKSLSRTGEPNLSPNSCRTFTICCRSKAMRPQPFIPKPMGRQNTSTKRLKNIYGSLLITYKWTGPTGYCLLCSHTTIECTYPPAKAPSKSITAPILILYQALKLKPSSTHQPPPHSCSKCRKSMQKPNMGPFKIMAKKGASAYTLTLPTNWCIHPTFNEILLTLYTPPTFPNQEQPPPLPPDLIDGEEHYEVEKVLNSREQTVMSLDFHGNGNTNSKWDWTS